MIQNSALSSKTIYDKFCKLQRTSSDYRFRAKSLRVRTINNQLDTHIVQKIGLPVIYPNQSVVKISTLGSAKKLTQNQESVKNLAKQRTQSYKIVEKNYQQELNNIGVDAEFLSQLFQKKCEETQSKGNQSKYQVFVKNLCQRLGTNKHLSIRQMGLGCISLEHFFSWYPQWQSHISEVDLTYASDLLKQSKMKIIKSLLTEDKKLMKIVLCNSSLEGEEITEILNIINEEKHLFALDIGNLNSQDLNRLGSNFPRLQQFFKKNASVAIVKLNNLHIKREGFECLSRGIVARRFNPLKVLSLASNQISGGKVCEHFYNLVRSGLTHLDLSNNPLGNEFFKNLPILKAITLKQLSLIDTKMSSENLYEFLQKLEESKTLSVLKADNNDFSHHWFGKIGQKLEVNSSLLWLSLNNCQIKTIVPLFQGLTHNKVLKRLDANNNEVECLSEDSTKIVNFFVFNKDLQEMRFRFCNLKEEILIKMLQGVSKNRKIKVLDISQNTMEDRAATNILKMLEENMVIESVGIEKLQLSQQMRKRIGMKLQENSTIREREEFSRLKNQTSQMKAKDNYSWEDLNKIEEEERRLNEYTKKLEEKTAKLQEMISSKRSYLICLTKDHKDEDHYLQAKIQDKLRKANENSHIVQKQYESMIRNEELLKDEMERELEAITKLQKRIIETNQNNKRMENQLEDKLRNHRYVQRKKSKYQNLVSMSPKRNSNCPTHFQK